MTTKTEERAELNWKVTKLMTQVAMRNPHMMDRIEYILADYLADETDSEIEIRLKELKECDSK